MNPEDRQNTNPAGGSGPAGGPQDGGQQGGHENGGYQGGPQNGGYQGGHENGGNQGGPRRRGPVKTKNPAIQYGTESRSSREAADFSAL